jgi:DNA polymerase-3 subunit epsilon
MKYLLGLDFETTGLDFEKDRITEIGAVLWDCEASAPVVIYNVLVKHEDAPPITEEITGLTGITQTMLDEFGDRPVVAFGELNKLIGKAGAIVAHNGSGFDKPMLEAQMKRYAQLGEKDPEFFAPLRSIEKNFEWTKPWVDTCIDIDFPAHITTRKLTHLAAEHGFLNPFSHRAAFDVLTMLKVLALYPLQPVLESAALPMKTLIARVSYDDRDKAKSRGYRWRGESKTWVRHMKAHKAEQEKAEAGFRVDVVDFDPFTK